MTSMKTRLRVATALCCALSAPCRADPEAATLPAYRPQAVSVPAGAGYVLPDGSVALGGAEHVRFILQRINARFMEAHPGIRFTDLGKGTTSAVPLLTHDRILFGSMGRGVTGLEAKAYAKIVGRAPLEIRIAHTADDTSQKLATSLAVYVHRDNPLTQITIGQLARAMTVGNPDGDVSTWSQLGLTGPWASRAIRPYGTPEFSGFGSYLQREKFAGRALAPAYEQHGDTKDILDRLEADPAGIAVAALGAERPGLRQVALADDPAGPFSLGGREDVQAGRYPLGRYLLVYVRRRPDTGLDPLVRDYLRLVLSSEGQAIIASQARGYIPLTAAEAGVERAKLD